MTRRSVSKDARLMPSRKLERALVRAGRNEGGLPPFRDLKEVLLAVLDEAYCRAALTLSRGNVSLAARLAHLDKKNFHRKLHLIGLASRTVREKRA